MNTRRGDCPDGSVRSYAFSGHDREVSNVEDRSDDWMRPGDEALLESLRRDGPESCPLLAARIGMHLKYARRRCEELESRGLVRSRDERFYELTEQGTQYLDGSGTESN